ncbi:HNH homing endonuclease [Bacillus phage Taffo16]|uniref:HNH endonuclease n=2 Tax=Bequatrovirus TaxID=1917990 RepID=A0A7U3T8W3_9CAUD|nr:HNH endonuclease [Bacillus phage Phrodo]ASZ75952.1 HNH homing endonuclease [Bacillus phage Taffo16]QPY77451.1 HNH endonuclease [Bacillus phage Anthos]UGO49029.1 HNH homing endonuclease [Bacillus phage vB_BanH_JarJar]UGO50519.1 HNH homing endonuclease [Bacillus phage vB_BanH_RonSwanson]ULF48846.1 HNH endonuclease [Bacillus phage BillyBob]
MEREVWKSLKDVVECGDNYEVSTLGSIRNNVTLRILKPYTMKDYKRIKIAKDNKKKSYLLHRLVALAFIDNPLNHPEVNHKDGNKSNNTLTNLEWCTRTDNLKHAYATNLKSHEGERHPRATVTDAQAVEIKEMIQNGYTTKEIMVKYGVSKYTVSRIKTGVTWKHIS